MPRIIEPAPGPYEVVTVIDEEGKARGSKGEQWILIKNEDGAIATVYPDPKAPGTARLLGMSWELLQRLKETREAAAHLMQVVDALATLHKVDIGLYLDDKHEGFGTKADLTIMKAEGRSVSSFLPGRTVEAPAEREPQSEANTESVFPETKEPRS
jgi:hypothetical protein